MKFEINPNELTAEQRNHVGDFIRNWPTYVPQLNSFDACYVGNVPAHLSEEQRLDAEQKAGLREFSGPVVAQALGTVAADNLNAIFGTPDIAKDMSALIEDRKSLVSDIMNNVPLDKEGLPWDSRIHSSSKAFIADGTWKLRRGVDPAEVATVKAQLRELMAVPQVGPVSVPVPPAPKSHYLIDQQPAVVTHNPGHIDVDPSSRIPAPKSIDQVPAVTLTDLISRISKAIAENRITQATVTEVCLKHRVSEFALLSNRPDLLPLIDADMKALGV